MPYTDFNGTVENTILQGKIWPVQARLVALKSAEIVLWHHSGDQGGCGGTRLQGRTGAEVWI